MSRKLSELHHNKIVLLDRVELNVLASMLTMTDEQAMLAQKVLKRVVSDEVKKNNPCMDVPIRVWELKKLFPDYETKPPIWWERQG